MEIHKSQVPSDYTWGGQVSDSTNRKEDGMCCFLPPGVKLPDTTGSIYVKPPYEIGDRIYVRETWTMGSVECGEEPDGREALFVEQEGNGDYFIPKEYCIRQNIGIEDVKWQPSLFMQKKYARIWLEVTNMRVQKVKDIAEDEALAEGFRYENSVYARFHFLTYMEHKYGSDIFDKWCWAIEFKEIQK